MQQNAEAAGPPAPGQRVRAALELPDDGATLKWGPLRDVLSCLLAEDPEQRPKGLDEGLWELIQRRVSNRCSLQCCSSSVHPAASVYNAGVTALHCCACACLHHNSKLARFTI